MRLPEKSFDFSWTCADDYQLFLSTNTFLLVFMTSLLIFQTEPSFLKTKVFFVWRRFADMWMHPCKAQEDAGAEVATPIMVLAVFSECTFHSRENESGRSRELRFGFTQSLIMSFIASCHVGSRGNSVAAELPVQCIYIWGSMWGMLEWKIVFYFRW